MLTEHQLYTIIGTLFSGNVFLIVAIVRYFVKQKEKEYKQINSNIDTFNQNLTQYALHLVTEAKASLKTCIKDKGDNQAETCRLNRKALITEIEALQKELEKVSYTQAEDIKDLYIKYNKIIEQMATVVERMNNVCREIYSKNGKAEL